MMRRILLSILLVLFSATCAYPGPVQMMQGQVLAKKKASVDWSLGVTYQGSITTGVHPWAIVTGGNYGDCWRNSVTGEIELAYSNTGDDTFSMIDFPSLSWKRTVWNTFPGGSHAYQAQYNASGNIWTLHYNEAKAYLINRVTGATIASFGGAGTGDGQFAVGLRGILLYDGEIYVADTANACEPCLAPNAAEDCVRIQVFNQALAEAGSASFVRKFVVTSEPTGSVFNLAQYKGKIYAAMGNLGIAIFSTTGVPQLTSLGAATPRMPTGLDASSSFQSLHVVGNVLVAGGSNSDAITTAYILDPDTLNIITTIDDGWSLRDPGPSSVCSDRFFLTSIGDYAIRYGSYPPGKTTLDAISFTTGSCPTPYAWATGLSNFDSVGSSNANTYIGQTGAVFDGSTQCAVDYFVRSITGTPVDTLVQVWSLSGTALNAKICEDSLTLPTVGTIAHQELADCTPDAGTYAVVFTNGETFDAGNYWVLNLTTKAEGVSQPSGNYATWSGDKARSANYVDIVSSIKLYKIQ